MAKSDNHKQTREFYIFDPITQEKIPATEEQFREYYRPIHRVYAFAKRHHQCACHKWWLCAGDCSLCTWARDLEQDALAQLHYDLETMNSQRYSSYDPEIATEREEFREKAEAFLYLLTGEMRIDFHIILNTSYELYWSEKPVLAGT